MISSTRWLSRSQRTRLPLPCTCSSPPGLAFSATIAAATSPERTVVSAHCGSGSVVEMLHTRSGRSRFAAGRRAACARKESPGVKLDGELHRDIVGRFDGNELEVMLIYSMSV